ncbi:MAG: hypothetical protein R3F43_00050 [bacterium]
MLVVLAGCGGAGPGPATVVDAARVDAPASDGGCEGFVPVAMPTVRAQIDRRGVSMDRYQDAGDSRGGLRKFAGGMAERLWDMVSSNHDDDHYAHALPGEFGAASQAIDIEGTLPVSPGGLAHMLDNTLTFGMVGGVVGLGTNTVHGIGALIEGDYEAAGADMTDAAVALLVHLGVKMLQKAGSAKSSQPGESKPAATGGLVGPEGAAQFTVPGFEGPLSAAEAKLGATVAGGLAVEAQAALGRLISRIGRGGVERVAGYLRNREAAAFVAEHGEAAVYALDEAQGNVAAARTRLPARQLGSGPASHAIEQVPPAELEASHGPVLSRRQMAKLTEDIRENGVREPVKFVNA